jgi:hypothetical protein
VVRLVSLLCFLVGAWLDHGVSAAQFMSNLSAAIVELPPASNPTSAQDGPASENAGMERDMGRVTQAETWAKEAYDVVHAAGVRPAHYYKDGDVSGDDDDVDNGSGESKKEKALPRVEVRNQVCDAALGAILYNVGMLKEVSGLPSFPLEDFSSWYGIAISRLSRSVPILHAHNEALSLATRRHGGEDSGLREGGAGSYPS